MEKDYVGVMNGDGDAVNGYIVSATYWGHSGNIWVGVVNGVNGNPIRINYIVVLTDQFLVNDDMYNIALFYHNKV